MNLFAIRNATLDARIRMQDESIGTRVECGELQIIRVTYDGRGISTVTPASDWVPVAEAVGLINAMEA